MDHRLREITSYGGYLIFKVSFPFADICIGGERDVVANFSEDNNPEKRYGKGSK